MGDLKAGAQPHSGSPRQILRGLTAPQDDVNFNLLATRDAASCVSTVGKSEALALMALLHRTGSDTHCHARRPFSRTTLSASPYSTNRLSTVVTDANGSLCEVTELEDAVESARKPLAPPEADLLPSKPDDTLS